VWTASLAPLGTTAYYLLYEGTGGSGATIHDIAGTANGTMAGGSLTWGSDAYGANLSGFSTTVAVTADALTSSGRFDSTAGYPRWMACMFKNTNTAGNMYVVHFGNSTETGDMWGFMLNPNAPIPGVGYILRDHTGSVNSYVGYNTGAATDGNYHVLLHVQNAANRGYLYLDGVNVGSDLVENPAAYTFQNFTLGAIRRNGTQVDPYLGTLSVALVGIGTVPDPYGLYLDLIGGQFGGTQPSTAGSSTSFPASLFLGV
jgi:hypothetical protein